MLSKPFSTSCHTNLPSYNRLQLPRITQRILNRQLTDLFLITLQINASLQALVREIYAAVFDEPAAVLGEGDDGAFAVEEEEVFGGGYGEGWVGGFAAGGDFAADLGY